MKQENIKILINLGLLVGIIFASIMLLFAIMTLIKNRDIIQQDAITYAMNEMDFVFCSCNMESVDNQNIAKCDCLDSNSKHWVSSGHASFISKTELRTGDYDFDGFKNKMNSSTP